MNTKSKSFSFPKQWTDDVVRQYEPVEELGRGGFAVVMLARKKGAFVDNKSDELVAIKVVGSALASVQERGYAMREIEILSELSHPNIVRILDHWKIPKSKGGAVAIMALSYEKGPTLLHLLKHGGCVSINFCRVVLAQLVDAIAYMHNRACVHRDIKPDNIIILDALENDEDIWEDTMKTEVDLVSLRHRWVVKLIDFGLARALTEEDFRKAHPEKELIRIDSDPSLTRSRHITRKLSAVGNRWYAAPEILHGVQEDGSFNSRKKRLDYSNHPIDVNKTLSEHVSFYGLMADAYSIGSTMKYMLTGVSPNKNVDDAIGIENSPIVLLFKLFSSCASKKKSDIDRRRRVVKYRRISQIPSEPFVLMKGLLNSDPSKRITVSQARVDPWINEILLGYQAIDHTIINYLPSVEQQETAENEVTA